MSPLQVMICYANSPAVVMAMFISGRVGFENLVRRFTNTATLATAASVLTSIKFESLSSELSLRTPATNSNVVPFKRHRTNLAA